MKDSGTVDESAHGDKPEPAGPEEARPVAADAPLRDPIVNAIPTVEPRLPTQVPPWPEEAGAADGAADVRSEVQDAPDVASEVVDRPIAPELPVEEVHDVVSEEPQQVAPGTEAIEPAAPAPPDDPPADVAGDVGNQETPPAAEPAYEAAALPCSEHAAPPAEEPAAHEPEEAEPEALQVEARAPVAPTSSESIAHPEPDTALAAATQVEVNAPVVPTSSEPVALPELDTAPAAATQVVGDINTLPTGPSEPPERADQPDVPVFDEPEPDEPPARVDASEVLQPAEVETETETETLVIDRPPDQQPAPIREEQIWSGPEATEPSVRWPEPEHTGTQPDPLAETDARTEPKLPADQGALPAFVAAAQGGPQSFAAVQSPLSPAWSSASLSSSERVRDGLSYVRFAARVAGAVALTLAAAVLLLVVLYRWIDPPASTLMLGQRLTGTEIEQTWVPIERISPNLVQAVILSEDGGFCRHRGVDWSALEEAIESSRGGSTITMQVVKNLFLWPGRNYVRKALEIALAYMVEIVWPKERVLEIYLNIAEWGPGVFGAEAAARSHFGKPASQLTAQEAALLAVSLPSPIDRQAGYPDSQTRRLANNLLVRMRAVRTAQRCVRTRRAGG